VPRGQAVSGINQTPPGGQEPRHLVTDNDLRFPLQQARLAPAQLPRRVLIRTDSGGGTHAFLAWLVGRRLHYSVGMAITEDMTTAILARQIGLCGVFRLEYQAAMSGI
jgi:hypothetical protein